MSLYKLFKTNPDLEKKGFVYDILDTDGTKTTFLLARAGGANKAFGNEVARLLKPHERAHKRNQLDDDVYTDITYEAASKYIVLSWDNVLDRDGKSIEYSPEACVALFKDLPDLADDLLGMAKDAGNYLEVERQEEAKS